MKPIEILRIQAPLNLDPNEDPNFKTSNIFFTAIFHLGVLFIVDTLLRTISHWINRLDYADKVSILLYISHDSPPLTLKAASSNFSFL